MTSLPSFVYEMAPWGNGLLGRGRYETQGDTSTSGSCVLRCQDVEATTSNLKEDIALERMHDPKDEAVLMLSYRIGDKMNDTQGTDFLLSVHSWVCSPSV